MPIHISKINLKKLGPLGTLKMEPGVFTLIYGENEKGKTFITEFIIRSLFKDIQAWSLRKNDGEGTVTLSGLDGDQVDFRMSTRKKLEEYIESGHKGIPPSFTRLLIVKGAESSIDESKDGIKKAFLKEILSGFNLTDKVEKKIPAVVKAAGLQNGMIQIEKKGKGKDKDTAFQDLERINGLLSDVEKNISGHKIADLKSEQQSITDAIKKMEKAKKHKAFKLAEELSEAENKKLPEDVISVLDSKLNEIGKMGKELIEKKKKLQEAQTKSQNYNWLEKAERNYETLITASSVKPSSWLPVLAIVLLVISIAFFLDRNDIFGILSVIGSVGIIRYYVSQLMKSAKLSGKQQELDNLKETFKERTGKELTDLSLLQTILSEERNYNTAAALHNDYIQDLDSKISNLKAEIEKCFSELINKVPDLNDWINEYTSIRSSQKNNNERIRSIQTQLAVLNVDSSDYVKESDADVIYSVGQMSQLINSRDHINVQINNVSETIQTLKIRIIAEVKMDASAHWQDALQELRKKRETTLNDYRNICASILAGIAITSVVKEIRDQEDNNIQEVLKSPEILHSLKELTGRYSGITLSDSLLMLSDEFSEFPLENLSTGAKEQVMLALRTGFVSRLFANETLFLILDDAFQHSDWKKREGLVNGLVTLAKKGWQIIYLTMDDHIRDLFNEIGRREFGDDYKFIALSNEG